MIITNFSIFKNTDKKSDKQPDYRLSAQIDGKFQEIGAGWIKDGKSGKFISVKMKETYGDVAGFYIDQDKKSGLTEEDKNTLAAIKGQNTPKDVGDEIIDLF